MTLSPDAIVTHSVAWALYSLIVRSRISRYEKNPTRKRVLTDRIKNYMKRAEQLKTFLKEQEDNEDNAVNEDSDGEDGDEDGGDDDDEGEEEEAE